MKNKHLGTLLLFGTAVAIIAYVFDGNIDVGVTDGLYTLTGLVWLVFGTWAGFRLINLKETK